MWVAMTVRWPRLLTPTHLSQIIRKQKNPLTALQLFNEAKLKYPSYRHNGPVYAAMIYILGNSGRISEMREVVDQMKNDSCECKDFVLAAAIRTYGIHGLLDEAISLFKNVQQFNCINWTESFSTLLQIMVNESKFEAAHRLFLERSYGWEIKSRIRSLNLLMHSLCQKGQSDLALCIFQEMDFQSCYPNRESYRILMKGLCDDGRLNEAIHLLYSMFWRISQKGSGGDIVIYRTLLYTLCDNKQVEQAVEILGKILRKGLKGPRHGLHHLDLNQYNNGEDIEGIKRLINEALIRGGIPSSASYTAMAVDLFNEGEIGQGDKVLNHMQHKGFRPTHTIYESKVAAYCREGRVDAAVKVIEHVKVDGSCVPTIRMYNTVVEALCYEGKSKLAVQYLKKMDEQLGCVADKGTYCIIFDGLCSEKRYLEASRVLEEMVIKSYWPCAETYNKLIKGLCCVDRQYEAIMWLEEMVSQAKLPEISVWTLLVASVCSKMVGINMFRNFYQAENK